MNETPEIVKQFLRGIAKKGGETTKKRRGNEWFVELAKKSAKVRRGHAMTKKAIGASTQ